MSTLKVNTIQHNTSGFNNVVQFTDGAGTQNGTLCRVWVNFNGTNVVTINNDFNVTSITDNGAGDYSVNFTNALSDANYASAMQVGYTASPPSNGSGPAVLVFNNVAQTTTVLRILTADRNTSALDSQYVHIAIFR